MLPPRTQQRNPIRRIEPAAEEFMDTHGWYWFRDSLTAGELGAEDWQHLEAHIEDLLSHSGEIPNGSLYEEVHARLCGPEPLDSVQLLKFMVWFARVFQATVRRACDRMLKEDAVHDTQSSDAHSGFAENENRCHVSIQFARMSPAESLRRFDALEAYRRLHPERAEVFELAEYVGAKDEEIAALLGVSETKVGVWRREAMREITAAVRSESN